MINRKDALTPVQRSADSLFLNQRFNASSSVISASVAKASMLAILSSLPVSVTRANSKPSGPATAEQLLPAGAPLGWFDPPDRKSVV